MSQHTKIKILNFVLCATFSVGLFFCVVAFAKNDPNPHSHEVSK